MTDSAPECHPATEQAGQNATAERARPPHPPIFRRCQQMISRQSSVACRMPPVNGAFVQT